MSNTSAIVLIAPPLSSNNCLLKDVISCCKASISVVKGLKPIYSVLVVIKVSCELLPVLGIIKNNLS